MTLFVRTAGDPREMIPTLRRQIGELDQDLPLVNIMTAYREPTVMSQVFHDSLWVRTLPTMLLLSFGLLALVLAIIGTYGVTTYSVTQRRHELGIRMALGAQRKEVLGLVLIQGMKVVGLGIGLGLLAAFLSSRAAASLLYGLDATDPPTYAGVALLLSAVAALANGIVAYRATRVDPVTTLRHE